MSPGAGISRAPRKGSVYLADGYWIDPPDDCPDDAYDPTYDPEGHAADVDALQCSGVACESFPEGVLVAGTFMLARDTRTWTASGTSWKGVYGYGEIGDLIRMAKAFGEGGTGAVVHASRSDRPPDPMPVDMPSSMPFVPDYSRLRRYRGGQNLLSALGLGSVDELVRAVNMARSEVGRHPVQTGNFPTNKRLFVRLVAEYAGLRSQGAVGR